MIATKENDGDKNLAAQQIRQKQLQKLRILLFGCRKDWPKKTQSEYCLTSTSKSSHVVDVSARPLTTSRSDIGRLPAGKCSCPAKPLPLDRVSESTQTVSSRDMSTQTQDADEDSCSPSVASLKRDVATQSSISISPKNQTKMFLRAEYQNVTKKLRAPAQIFKEEDDPNEASISDSLTRKWSFKRPVIVVNRSHAGLSVPKGLEVKGDARTQRNAVIVKQTQTKDQSPPSKASKLSASKGKKQEENINGKSSISVAPSKENKETQYESQLSPEKPTPEKQPSDPLTCSRIPELLNRVNDLESKLRDQERSLRSLHGSMKSWKVQESKPSECTLIFQAPPPRQCALPCKPTSSVDQATQKTDEDYPALSKECVNVYIKSARPSQSIYSGCANSQNDVQKPISTQCPLKINNEYENSRKDIQNNISTQSCEDFSTKLKNQDSICRSNKSEKSMPPRFAIPTVQCLKEPEAETENLLDKFAKLVTPKPKEEMASTASCSTKNNVPEPSDCRQSMQKEVYESMLKQFIKYFTKPKTVCGEKPEAPKNECEYYSFERLCAELINLFFKPKDLEASPVKEEDKLKRVTISGKDQMVDCQESIDKLTAESISIQPDTRDEKPCQADRKLSICEDTRDEKPCQADRKLSICEDPPASPSGSQLCSDGHGNLPVLDSLVDELLYIIGPKDFNDIVLTIVRRGSNVYHINVREIATGNVLGSLRANGAAINEAISLGLFEEIQTFCELNRHRADDPRDCPFGTNLDVMVPQREHGGENQLASRDASKEKAIEFATRVLGLQPGEAGRFFSLTNALKLARKSTSDQRHGGPELSKVSKKTGLIGRGAVTGNLVFMGSVDSLPVTRQSQPDLSELGEASRHFLRLLSGQELEEDKF